MKHATYRKWPAYGAHYSYRFVPVRVTALEFLLLDLNIQGRWKLVYVTADYEKLRDDISHLSKEDIDGYIQQKKQEVAQFMAVRRSVSLVVPFLLLLACTEMRGVG